MRRCLPACTLPTARGISWILCIGWRERAQSTREAGSNGTYGTRSHCGTTASSRKGGGRSRIRQRKYTTSKRGNVFLQHASCFHRVTRHGSEVIALEERMWPRPTSIDRTQTSRGSHRATSAGNRRTSDPAVFPLALGCIGMSDLYGPAGARCRDHTALARHMQNGVRLAPTPLKNRDGLRGGQNKQLHAALISFTLHVVHDR
jgi:hypothetical protein